MYVKFIHRVSESLNFVWGVRCGVRPRQGWEDNGVLSLRGEKTIVYLCTPRQERKVAIKVIHTNLPTSRKIVTDSCTVRKDLILTGKFITSQRLGVQLRFGTPRIRSGRPRKQEKSRYPVDSSREATLPSPRYFVKVGGVGQRPTERSTNGAWSPVSFSVPTRISVSLPLIEGGWYSGFLQYIGTSFQHFHRLIRRTYLSHLSSDKKIRSSSYLLDIVSDPKR